MNTKMIEKNIGEEQMNTIKAFFSNYKDIIISAIVLVALIEILPKWSSIWHTFGENLYHMFH